MNEIEARYNCLIVAHRTVNIWAENAQVEDRASVLRRARDYADFVIMGDINESPQNYTPEYKTK